MENNSIAKLILGFLVLIVGIALIGSVAQGGNLVTEKTGVSAEALDIALDRNVIDDCPMGINGTYEFTITNAPTGWKVASCPISDFVLYNQTRAAAAVTVPINKTDKNRIKQSFLPICFLPKIYN